ncbi:MAG TPA: hypothetical protein VKU85_19900 [bacterium]|nr:hypothetical protein [bacterium]
MKALMTIAACVFLTAVAAPAQNYYGWTISNSTTDPLSNSGPIAPGPSAFSGNLYLWFACNSGDGAIGAEFAVEERRGAGLPTAFSPAFPILNPPPLPDVLILFPCSNAPVLAGVFSVGADAFVPDIELCIVQSSNGLNVTVDCNGVAWPNTSVGFAKTGGGTCVEELCQMPVSVDRSSWGRMKGLYR